LLQFGGLVKSVTFVCREVTVFSSVLRRTIIVMCNYLQLVTKELLHMSSTELCTVYS